MARRAGLDHEQVLQAAAELADAAGPEGLTLGALAHRLDVRAPSLYNYVAGLPGLQRELAARATRLLGQRLARAAIGKARDAAVLAVAGAMRAFIREHPGLYALTVRSSLLAQATDPDLDAAQEEVVAIVAAVVGSYGLQGEVGLHAVRGLRSIVHGFATLEAAGGFGIPLDLDTSFLRLVQMFLAGLNAASEGD